MRGYPVNCYCRTWTGQVPFPWREGTVIPLWWAHYTTARHLRLSATWGKTLCYANSPESARHTRTRPWLVNFKKRKLFKKILPANKGQLGCSVQRGSEGEMTYWPQCDSAMKWSRIWRILTLSLTLPFFLLFLCRQQIYICIWWYICKNQ